MERKAELQHIYTMLNSPDGAVFMREMKKICFDPKGLDPNPIITGHNIGLMECYKQLLLWQTGDKHGDE